MEISGGGDRPINNVPKRTGHLLITLIPFGRAGSFSLHRKARLLLPSLLRWSSYEPIYCIRAGVEAKVGGKHYALDFLFADLRPFSGADGTISTIRSFQNITDGLWESDLRVGSPRGTVLKIISAVPHQNFRRETGLAPAPSHEYPPSPSPHPCSVSKGVRGHA